MLVFKSELKVNQTLNAQVGATAVSGSDQIAMSSSDKVVYLGQVGYQICSPARIRVTLADGKTVEAKTTLRNLQINKDFAPTTFDRTLKQSEIFYYMVVADLGNRGICIGDIVCLSANEVEKLTFVANTRLRHVRPTNDLAHLTPAVYTIADNGRITKDEVKNFTNHKESTKSATEYKGFKLKVKVMIEGTDMSFDSVDEAYAAIDTYTRFSKAISS